jgi:enediyne biosynthesis protein E4
VESRFIPASGEAGPGKIRRLTFKFCVQTRAAAGTKSSHEPDLDIAGMTRGFRFASITLITLACAAVTLLFLRNQSTQSDNRKSLPAPDQSAGVLESSITFKEQTREAGLSFVHILAQPEAYYFPDIMSSGAALFDFDNDGRLDILLLNGSGEFPHRTDTRSPSTDSASARKAGNRYFRQNADGTFSDQTQFAGLADAHYGSGVAVGDLNNDGWPDVYLSNVGDDQLYMNRGDGSFTNATEQAGIRSPLWGTSVAFVDFERDGWLDIYVVNYVDYHASRKCVNRHGGEDYCNPSQFAPTCDKLYRNITATLSAADDTAPRVLFEDVSDAAGISTQRGPGLGVLCADFNDDGWPDIYVANDGAPNFLWINQRDGTFRDEAIVRGVATDAQGQPQSSMGVVFDDIDGDGLADLFMTHFSGELHTLYRQVQPGGYFADQTVAARLADTFHHTGFGVVFCDLEHDGDLDIVVANGHVKRPSHALEPRQGTANSSDRSARRPFAAQYGESNQVYLNDGSGRFHDERGANCPFRGPAEVSRALACGDVNGDGAIDFLVSNGGGPARLYLNQTPHRGNWLLVRAVEPQFGGRDAYGAEVTVVAGGVHRKRTVRSAFSYLSAGDPRAHFGLGSLDTIEQIIVRWPDGSREVFPGGNVNRSLTLAHGQGESS